MILANVLVDASENHRFLESVVNRIHAWADEIHFATVHPNSILAANGKVTKVSEEHFLREAWEGVREMAQDGDTIGQITSDQVVFDYEPLKRVVKQFPEHLLYYNQYYMYDGLHYYDDVNLGPSLMPMLFPFRDEPYGTEQIPEMPAYVGKLQRMLIPIGDVLDYSMMGEKDSRHSRWMRGGLLHV